MTKTAKKSSASTAEEETTTLSKNLIKTDNKLSNIDERLTRLEKRLKSNERFARTFANCLTTQVVAIDAVTEAMRHGLQSDVEIHEELAAAIKAYDRHKVRRWFSGFFGVLLWISSVTIAAVAGAFIYWLFSGQ